MQRLVTNALAHNFGFAGLAAAGGRAAVTPLDQYLNTVAGRIDPATGRPFTYMQLQQDLGDPTVNLRFHYLNLFLRGMGHLPGMLGRRLSPFDQEFTPSARALHADASDPLDP